MDRLKSLFSPEVLAQDVINDTVLENITVSLQADRSLESWLVRGQLSQYGYGSIPINTIFRGMNIHLPAILMFTRGTRF
jgi:hypothetical protein